MRLKDRVRSLESAVQELRRQVAAQAEKPKPKPKAAPKK